jgi:hypothetical protein
MILSATTKEPVARLSGPQRLDRIWKAIAVVFMPQVSSAYVFLALSIANGIEETPLYLLVSILFASSIELGSLLVYVRFSKRDANVQDREDRPVLFAIAILSYLVGFALLRYLGAPFIFSALMFAYFANTTLAAVITRYLTKVSIHTWGITGPSVAILYSFGVLGFLLMLVIGAIVGSTRIKLGYHTWRQVALSFLTSIPFTWFIVYIVPQLLPTIFRAS